MQTPTGRLSKPICQNVTKSCFVMLQMELDFSLVVLSMKSSRGQCMNKQRKHYTAEEKVGMIRKHLLGSVAVSDLCEENQLNPNLYYRWQKEFFEGGAVAFAKDSNRQVAELKKQLAAMKEQLSRKNEVLAEVTEEYVRCKKNWAGQAERPMD
ncbi:MAG: transposase [Methylococcales bacterium]